MRSLTQHIKADGSSLIPLEEKLHIGKDYKPDIKTMVNNAVNILFRIFKERNR